MAEMQDIEAAIGGHDAFALATLGNGPTLRLGEVQNRRFSGLGHSGFILITRALCRKYPRVKMSNVPNTVKGNSKLRDRNFPRAAGI
jgi:hypothetical protein